MTAQLIPLRVQLKLEREARNSALVRHIVAGGTVKEFAADYGITKERVGKLAAALGLRHKWVTKEEGESVDRQRRSKAGLDRVAA